MEPSNCQIAGCSNPATHLTSTESNFIEICADHWHEKYRK